MIGDHRSAEDYRAILDPERARRVMLYRAAAAAAVMVVLLLGLMWFDRGDEDVATADEADAQASQPGLPAVSQETVARPLFAPLDAPAEGAEEGADADAVAEVQADPSGATDVSAAGTDPLQPPAVVAPDAVASAARAAAPGATAAPAQAPSPPAAPRSTVTAAAAPTPPVAPRRPAEPVAPRAPAAPATPSQSAPADGYRVQVGDYLALSSAEELQNGLASGGHVVDMQRRVAVGGYPSRQEAENAAARLKRDQKLNGFIVAGEAGGFLVQVGVFSDPANAESLRRQLATAGYKPQLHARVVLGPYPDKAAAERVAAQLRAERGIAGVVVVPRS
ncbi:MAG: SPOR domain-containing protein [Rhodocyclaceae bacterium]